MSCHHRQPQHCCCCFSNGSSNTRCCSSNTAPNASNSSDQLLQTLALILQSQPPPHPQPHHHIYLKPQRYRPPPPQPKNDHQESLILRSLIRRVAALESSLSSKGAALTPHTQPLKHSAAATIQRHFRRFLARRSRTLRDLKQLAVVKSCAAALRSSISSKSLEREPRAVAQEAMDLLVKLDSIQSSDPMIREGKRAISRELVRVSEFVEKVLAREQEEEENERDWRVKDNHWRRVKRVSFAENGSEAQMFDDLPQRIFEAETDGGVEGFYFSKFSDGSDEESPEVRCRANGSGAANRWSGLAAPVPMRMEPKRSGSMS